MFKTLINAWNVKDIRTKMLYTLLLVARNLRTVFNRVGRRLPRDLGYPHLDAVLDAIGARLLGMIPEGADLPYSAATGNIAARLCGESRPLLAVYRP